jgi:Ca-activated chloride channel family protein
MKASRLSLLVLASSLSAALVLVAQGPLNSGSETVARPKKGNTTGNSPDSTTAPAAAPKEAPDQSKIPSQFKKGKELPQGVATYSTDAVTVTVDVSVLDNRGHFIPNIPAGNFRVTEDNIPQKITTVTKGEAPMTIALVIEFSGRFQQVYTRTWRQTLEAAYGFVQTLKPEDYLAVVAYDLRSEILSDFSNDRRDAQEALSRLNFPAFSEANMFDALTDTAQRMQDIEGRKAILLLSSGVDTFSKLNYGEARKAIQNAGVPIYAVGLMQAYRDIIYGAGALSDSANMTFLQADNQLRTFTKESGGIAYFPHFEGQMPEIYRDISEVLRSQYVLTYTPSNTARDGKFRKIKVELVNPENNQPLRINDEKGKPVKFEIVAKPGYTAPKPVE